MNKADFTKIKEERVFSNKGLLTLGIGAAAAAAAAAALFWSMKRSIPAADPPPIIIKSGSFSIESDKPLLESIGNPNIYSRPAFGEIKGVRVFRTNEMTGDADSDDFEDRDGIEVDIRLQKLTGNGWNDINQLVTIRAEGAAGNPKDFNLRIGKKLHKKGHPKPGRRERREDDGTENIRFGYIAVREADGGNGDYYAEDGDDFIITFYNRLV